MFMDESFVDGCWSVKQRTLNPVYIIRHHPSEQPSRSVNARMYVCMYEWIYSRLPFSVSILYKASLYTCRQDTAVAKDFLTRKLWSFHASAWIRAVERMGCSSFLGGIGFGMVNRQFQKLVRLYTRTKQTSSLLRMHPHLSDLIGFRKERVEREHWKWISCALHSEEFNHERPRKAFHPFFHYYQRIPPNWTVVWASV